MESMERRVSEVSEGKTQHGAQNQRNERQARDVVLMQDAERN